MMLMASLSFVGVAASAQEAQPTYEEVINDPALTPTHSIVIRLYAAVLGRQPDVGGVIFWLEAYDSGEWPLDRIAQFFITSDEFQGIYGDLNNQDFADAIYRNVLNRAPDQAGLTFWTDQLNQGMARARMVLLISNAPEFIANNPLPSDAPTNEAESNLQFDYGKIDRFQTINGVDWIWFDRWSFGSDQLAGPELQSEPRWELASDWHGGGNVNPRLRAYPLAPDADVLVIDAGVYDAVCGGDNVTGQFNASDLASLVALDGLTSLTFDDNQHIVLVRDQRGC